MLTSSKSWFSSFRFLSGAKTIWKTNFFERGSKIFWPMGFKTHLFSLSFTGPTPCPLGSILKQWSGFKIPEKLHLNTKKTKKKVHQIVHLEIDQSNTMEHQPILMEVRTNKLAWSSSPLPSPWRQTFGRQDRLQVPCFFFFFYVYKVFQEDGYIKVS